MSAETMTDLRSNILVGNTAKRGPGWRAWWSNGTDNNHFEGPVPIEKAIALVDFPVIRAEVFGRYMDENGVTIVDDPDSVMIVNGRTGKRIKIHGSGYQEHTYRETLIDGIAEIVRESSGDLQVGTVGLLRNGGVCWVQVEMPENLTTPEGVTFRPFVYGSTSYDGTMATDYGTANTLIVCDNTLSAARSEKGKVSVKHSKHSLPRLKDARQAMAMLETEIDLMSAEIANLCAVDVSDKAWKAFLDAHVPIPETEGRGRTMAANKRAAFVNLWERDPMVSPWKGTAFGVLQADNTYRHHILPTRGETGRGDRIAESMLRGKTAKDDSAVLETLGKVLASV